jgi:endoglucanase
MSISVSPANQLIWEVKMFNNKRLWLILVFTCLIGAITVPIVLGAPSFNSGVASLSSSSVQFWVNPGSWTASYVILHYTVSGETQRNVNMNFNEGAKRWEYNVSGLAAGKTIGYSYTYNTGGLQYDSATVTYTVEGGSSGSGSNAVTPISRSAFSSGDFLKTSGVLIKNNYGNGATVDLRGTNLGGWLLQEPWMSPCSVVDEWNLRETLTGRFGEATKESLISGYQNAWLNSSDLDNIKNMGMNLVRVPILYLELMDKYGNWKSNPWAKLDWLVAECSSRGIYVLLDLHGTFGGQNTFDNCGEANSDPQLWRNAQYQERTVRLWEGIAAHYRGNPTIAGYDLLNEPDRVGKEQLNAYYDRLYKAVRAIDPDHIIYMEAAWDWNQLDAPSVHGWKNVIYEMHYYAMAGSEASDWNAQNNLIESALKGIREHQSMWNVPVFAGEFCVFDFNDLWEKFLTGFNSFNVSWTNWTYKVRGGGNWGYYNNNTNAVPDLKNDSASSIASKWSQFNTSNFRANSAFQNIVKKCTGVSSAAPSGYHYLRAMANQCIVCAEDYGNGPLVANRANASDWELFQVIYNNDGTIAFQSKVNGKYVCADLNQDGKLVARSSVIDTWEKFKMIDLGNGTFALQAMANQMYVCADGNQDSVLMANRSGVGGSWESFILQ